MTSSIRSCVKLWDVTCLTEIVATERSTIMDEVSTKANVLLKDYGIQIIDVRIKRTDLPQENQMAIYGRMQANVSAKPSSIDPRDARRRPKSPLRILARTHGHGRGPA